MLMRKQIANNIFLIHRYIQKFYQMRTQLQAISLRIQVRHSHPPKIYALGTELMYE